VYAGVWVLFVADASCIVYAGVWVWVVADARQLVPLGEPSDAPIPFFVSNGRICTFCSNA
jgi:hypothetical protein